MHAPERPPYPCADDAAISHRVRVNVTANAISMSLSSMYHLPFGMNPEILPAPGIELLSDYVLIIISKKHRKNGLSLNKRRRPPCSQTNMNDARMQRSPSNVMLAVSILSGITILTEHAILQDLAPSPEAILSASFGSSISEPKSGLRHQYVHIDMYL